MEHVAANLTPCIISKTLSRRFDAFSRGDHGWVTSIPYIYYILLLQRKRGDLNSWQTIIIGTKHIKTLKLVAIVVKTISSF